MPTSLRELPRGTVTFLFTDMERSTELARQLRSDFGRVRAEHQRVLRDAFEQHGGHEIDTAGDGFFVAFERAADAVAAAVAGQKALQRSAQGDAAAVRVRMGVHSAEPYLHDDAYVGVGVHRAARICAAGHGGQILLSNATAGIVEDLDLDGVHLEDLGEHELKDLERPQRLFQVVVDDLPSTFPAVKSVGPTVARAQVLTLLYTDVLGWLGILRTLGDERAAVVARAYHEIVVEAVKRDGGRETEVVADAVMAVFERARDAVRAAANVRTALETRPWFPDGEPPAVRMGVHSGRVADPTARHLGSVAVTCINVCHAAEPWQILVSHATEALLEGEPLEVNLRDLGERTLPNRDRPIRVFEVDA